MTCTRSARMGNESIVCVGIPIGGTLEMSPECFIGNACPAYTAVVLSAAVCMCVCMHIGVDCWQLLAGMPRRCSGCWRWASLLAMIFSAAFDSLVSGVGT